MGGLSEPVIGTFAIKIGDILFTAMKRKKRSKSITADPRVPSITIAPRPFTNAAYHYSDSESEDSEDE